MGPAIWLAILCLGVAEATQSSDPSLDSEWQAWKIKYNKNYSLVSNMNTVQPDLMQNGSSWEILVKQRSETPPFIKEFSKVIHQKYRMVRISILMYVKNDTFCSFLRPVS